MTITLDGSDGMSFDVMLAMAMADVVVGVRSWLLMWSLYRMTALTIDKRNAGSGCQ